MKRKGQTFSSSKQKTIKYEQPTLKNLFLKVDNKEVLAETSKLIPQESNELKTKEIEQNLNLLDTENDIDKMQLSDPNTNEEINIQSSDYDSNIKIGVENILREKSFHEEVEFKKNSEIVEKWHTLPWDLCCSKFEISNFGRIRNIRTLRITKLTITNSLYRTKVRNDNSKSICLNNARLVAQIFIPNPSNLKFVAHIDGNKNNNRVDNLKWTNEKPKQKSIMKRKKVTADNYSYQPQTKHSKEINGISLPPGITVRRRHGEMVSISAHIQTNKIQQSKDFHCKNEDPALAIKEAILWREEKEKEKKALIDSGELVGCVVTKKNKKVKVRKDELGHTLPRNLHFITNIKGEKSYAVHFPLLNLQKRFYVSRFLPMNDARETALKFYNEHIEKDKEIQRSIKGHFIGNKRKETKKSLEQGYSAFTNKIRKPSVLTFTEWSNLVLSECYYCARSATIHFRNGVDRLNSDLYYIFENCVGACFICNAFKGKLSLGAFFAHLRLILINHSYQTIIPRFVFSSVIIHQILHPNHTMFRRTYFLDKRIYDINNDQDTLKRYQRFRSEAKTKRNLECQITFLEFKEIIQKECVYCKVSPMEANIGPDRIDSFKGYLKDNIHPSCSACNLLKGANTERDFFVHCEKILETQGFTMVKNEHIAH